MEVEMTTAAAHGADRARAFHQLHERGIFVSPNPWDIGSARVLVQLGFKALATTSSGFAWSMGRQDNRISLDAALAHYRALASAVDVPVSADFEDGFASLPKDVARNVRLASETGLAGVSVEDSTRSTDAPLIDFDLAVDRIAAARAAIDETGTGLFLTARSEGFIVGRPDLDETIRRLTAFAAAGADCLFAPGIRDMSHIAAVVKAVAPKPVNVIVSSGFTTVNELAEIGVRRISVGGALARSAWTGFLHAASEIAEHGTFTALGRAISGVELNGRFAGSERDR
jgi:2-methylisocitrate lyase-like PEP mutase family enzyme